MARRCSMWTSLPPACSCWRLAHRPPLAWDALVWWAAEPRRWQVQLHSLKTRSELNGKHATVLAYMNDSARYAVKVDTERRRMTIRSENLQVIATLEGTPTVRLL